MFRRIAITIAIVLGAIVGALYLTTRSNIPTTAEKNNVSLSAGDEPICPTCPPTVVIVIPCATDTICVPSLTPYPTIPATECPTIAPTMCPPTNVPPVPPTQVSCPPACPTEQPKCRVIHDYQLKNLPEVATSGSFIHVEFFRHNGDPEQEVILQRGRYPLNQPLDGHVWEYSLECSFEQVKAEVDRHIALRRQQGANNAGYADQSVINQLFN